MSGIQAELGPKGFQVIEAAFNDNPDVPGFIRRFTPPFPVGIIDHLTAVNYMQLSPMARTFVPYMLIIDRAGMIRAQYTGTDPFLADEFAEEKNIRTEVEKLLSENVKSTARTVRRPARK